MIGYRYRRDRQILCSALAFIAMIATGIYLQPGFRPLTAEVSGDKALVAFLTPLLKGAHGHVAAALITPDGVRYGLWGADYARQYEIGSLTKTMTASLLIDAIQRGEVTPTTRVGELVPETCRSGEGHHPRGAGIASIRFAAVRRFAYAKNRHADRHR